MQRLPYAPDRNNSQQRSYRWIIGGAFLLAILSIILLYVVITGKTRKNASDPFVSPTSTSAVSTTTQQSVRRIDGVTVLPGQEALRPLGVMIDNQIDALPWSGVDKASLVIESPVEGGITRLFALFDPATASSTEIGPVRSARPYFLDWAAAWNASYAHVGGSPEALDRLRVLGNAFPNIDEMANAKAFRRDKNRAAPHNVYTSIGALQTIVETRYGTSTSQFAAWRFEPLTTSTSAVISAPSVRIPYGGSYSITWKYDAALGQYHRLRGATVQKTRSGSDIYASNVIVIKTDSQVLDAQGRLQIRTTGGGDALLYHSGKKYVARWSRSPGEAMRFEGADGSEYSLTAGTTWIQVTTDDGIFAGLSPNQIIPTAN